MFALMDNLVVPYMVLPSSLLIFLAILHISPYKAQVVQVGPLLILTVHLAPLATAVLSYLKGHAFPPSRPMKVKINPIQLLKRVLIKVLALRLILGLSAKNNHCQPPSSKQNLARSNSRLYSCWLGLQSIL